MQNHLGISIEKWLDKWAKGRERRKETANESRDPQYTSTLYAKKAIFVFPNEFLRLCAHKAKKHHQDRL